MGREWGKTWISFTCHEGRLYNLVRLCRLNHVRQDSIQAVSSGAVNLTQQKLCTKYNSYDEVRTDIWRLFLFEGRIDVHIQALRDADKILNDKTWCVVQIPDSGHKDES